MKKLLITILITLFLFNGGFNTDAAELYGTALISDANLAAYYKLEDATDNQDSGTDYDLTNNNSVSFSLAKFNNGADFGSSDGNKNLSQTDLGITDRASDISFSFWVKLNTEISTGAYRFFEKTIAPLEALGYSIVYEYNSGTRRIGFWRERHGVVGYKDYYNITLGTANWYHIVLTYSNGTAGGQMKGYINAVERTTRDSCSGVGAKDANMITKFCVGGGWNGYTTGSHENLLGIIDDFAVFNKTLTSTEVSTLYNDASSPVAATPLNNIIIFE